MRSSRTSLASCIALCGGNTRLLWPRPTGNVLLGDDSLVIHAQQIEFVTVNTSDQETKNLLEHAKDVFIGEDSTAPVGPRREVTLLPALTLDTRLEDPRSLHWSLQLVNPFSTTFN